MDGVPHHPVELTGTKKGRFDPPLSRIQIGWPRLLRAVCPEYSVFLVPDEAELRHTGRLDDVEHTG